MIFWRILFFLSGIILLSLGISLTIKAQMIGVGSWDVLHIGLTDTFGLTIGIWTIILGVFIIAIESSIMRRPPKIGTILDMILAGIFIDIFNFLLPAVHGFLAQLIVFCVGILIYGFGAGMYIVANIGVGPRDSFMLLLSHKLGWRVSTARTVIMAFGLGPIMQWAMKINEKLFWLATGKTESVYS